MDWCRKTLPMCLQKKKNKQKKENNDNERREVGPETFDVIGQSLSNALRNHYYYRHESN